MTNPADPPARPAARVDFATVEYADGSRRTLLTRLTDGRVMCQLCFEYVTREHLNPVDGEPGVVEDVCRRCAAQEGRVRGDEDR